MRHRRRARRENLIRAARDSGARNLPDKSFDANAIWLQIVMLAQLLAALLQRLALDGDLAVAEPKRLRPLPARVRRRGGRSLRAREPTHGPVPRPRAGVASLRLENDPGGNMSQHGATRGIGETTPAGLWDRPHVRYLIIAYAWSWVLWLAAFGLSKAWDTDVLYNQDFVWRVAFERDVPGEQFLVSLVSMVAVYGPLIGALIMSRRDPAIPAGSLAERTRRVAVGGRMYGLVLGILLLVTLPPLIVSAVAVEPSPDAPSLGLLLPFLLAFFLVQMLTSGTEEFGWRGYLTEKMLPGRNFWDTGWAVGLVWAVWHLPVTVMIFLEQGLAPAAILGSLVGFGIGIVAMSILHTWFYERTRSVFLAVFIHAIFNTVPLTIVLLFEGSPAAVMSNLLLWAVVIYLKSRWDKEQPEIETADG